MKSILLNIGLLISCLFAPVLADDLYPSLDLNFPTILPKNFRIPTGPFIEQSNRIPSREGLEKLRCSASGQFLPTSLVLMLYKLPQDKKVIILDLREESHGYINSWPIAWRHKHTTWTNVGKLGPEIEKDEIERLKQIAQAGKVVLDPETQPFAMNVWSTCTEKEMLDSLNVSYLRIPITENHSPPDAVVDQLVELIRTLPDDVWLHVHCHGGRGRTTTFLVMYDSIVNGKKVSLEDIMLRQNMLGGSDILKPLNYDDPRHIPLEERVKFIRRFYDYATKNDISKVKYSEWMKIQRKLRSSQVPLPENS